MVTLTLGLRSKKLSTFTELGTFFYVFLTVHHELTI